MKRIQMPESFMNEVARLIIELEDEPISDSTKEIARKILKMMEEKADRIKSREAYRQQK